MFAQKFQAPALAPRSPILLVQYSGIRSFSKCQTRFFLIIVISLYLLPLHPASVTITKTCYALGSLSTAMWTVQSSYVSVKYTSTDQIKMGPNTFIPSIEVWRFE